jgi:hypothetical protein
MKWAITVILYLFSVFWPLYFVFGQDAKANQILLIPPILNELDQITNNLEANTAASNKVISNLQMKVNSMSNTIEMQQRQLNQDSQNYQNLEQTAQEKFNAYEASYSSLETSYKVSLTLNQEKEKENSKLKVTIADQRTAIVIMGAILAAIAAAAIAWLVIKIKSGALLGLVKKIL